MTDGALFDDAVGRAPVDTWTVPELSAHLGRVLAGALPGDVWVTGQIRNLNRSGAGHVYFDLTEPVEGGAVASAQLSVTLLAPERHLVNEQLKRAGGGVRMSDGIEVRVCGRIRWYAPRGTVQLRMHAIDPAFTLGRLEEDRDRLLAALRAEGLLDRNGRLPLPLVPLRVALVTSTGSAAHADVLATLRGTDIGFVLHEVDVRTQGPDSATQIALALGRLADRAHELDVVLLVRGGGARTDLAGFDHEVLARAIAALPIPVLTGIGHEIDRSIADEVAHSAHKTPTAAANALVERVRAYLTRVDASADSLHRAVSRSLAHASQRLDDRHRRLGRAATRALDRHDALVAAAGTRVPVAAARALDRATKELELVAARTQVHDPAHALARGWSITTTADGNPVRSIADAPPGTRLVIRVADGTLAATVDPDDPQESP